MKWLVLCRWSWVLLLLVLMGSESSIMGCLKEERMALLHIKAAFNDPNGSSLPEWQDGDGDCCNWPEVVCDNTTSRVTQLDLSGTRQGGLPWVIDASLFLPLEELQVLDLSSNGISDMTGTLHLKKLKRLYLGGNHLERVTSLYKQASAEAQNLSSTNQLEDLNLEALDLSSNDLGNDAITDITRITSLKALDIQSCQLNASSKLLEGLCGLKKLEELVISSTGFWGPLPPCFCNMTSLRALDIRYNYFTGAIPSCLLSNLKSLEYIDFSENAFEGSLSLASLANSSNLEVFRLIHNSNRLVVNTEEPTWIPSFQLKVFTLPNCVLNEEANGVIPSFLKEQHCLEVVQLSHNGMTGDFPNWLLENNAHLANLDLRGNNLSGSIYLPSKLNHVYLLTFDMSANFIEGELPSRIGYNLPMLNYLNLSNNNLKGGIPSSMGNMNMLNALDLSHNGFTGEIPRTLAEHCVLLFFLKLSSNNLQGQILQRSSNLTRLRYLYLDNNQFTGNLSPGILNSTLQVLDVSNNFLSGKIPDWIGDLEYLEMLMLSSNSFGGPLPPSFCNLHNLDLLDLSSNNLGPNIPPCANVTIMRFLHLANDTLVGHFPLFLSGASSIVTLDLRHNALSGKIPNWIRSLRNLKVLLLQGNNFEGLIPLDLCLLKNMSILDLSKNKLFGKIPSCLKDLTFGKDGEAINAYSTLRSFPAILIPYEGRFEFHYSYIEVYTNDETVELEVVNFMTKRRLESYKDKILRLMSGMDLSQNNLIGFIPPEIGQLSELRALNLSYNYLTGPIPEMFSNLREIESLDLSYNNLTGPIPPQLTKLYSLSNFRVAHNNLSGRIPDRKDQFGTFDEASYEGNPFLCGAPLRSCDKSNHEAETPSSLHHTREDDYWREAFWWSFAGSYIVAFLGVVLFLYLNSYYLCVMLNFIRKLIPSFSQYIVIY